MPSLFAPSISLLRTLLSPQTTTCLRCQTRNTSNFMPRHKYAKVNRLDKLHRKQKQTIRQEKKDTLLRAQALEESMKNAIGDAPAAQASLLPYKIARTAGSNLPVYESVKAGGSKHITTVRKLSGDLRALQSQIRSILQLPEHIVDKKGRKKETVAINNLTQHLIIRGWRGAEIKKWAELTGF